MFVHLTVTLHRAITHLQSEVVKSMDFANWLLLLTLHELFSNNCFPCPFPTISVFIPTLFAMEGSVKYVFPIFQYLFFSQGSVSILKGSGKKTPKKLQLRRGCNSLPTYLGVGLSETNGTSFWIKMYRSRMLSGHHLFTGPQETRVRHITVYFTLTHI